jgi:GTP-binding protein
MLPTIAIVGRPNVGKSTLFNALTKTREALVAAEPELTRDRKFGRGRVGERDYWLIDTGGLSSKEDAIVTCITQQVFLAIQEADNVLFVVDGRESLTAEDEKIAQQLRQFNKRIYLVVNKTEGLQSELVCAEFHHFGFAEVHAISAAHQRGLEELMERVLSSLPPPEELPETIVEGIKVAIIGRPNVGKSTLVNRMLGYERVIVFDQPGTTRDSIAIPFERDGQLYTLIDTAGIRRRARVSETVEKFSVIKALQAIEVAQVVLMVLDAKEGMTEQDASLLGEVLENGRAVVIAVNKWDGLSGSHREEVRYHLSRKLHFIDFAEIHFISALHGSGVGNLFASVQRAWEAAQRQIQTAVLNDVLQQAVVAYQPPLAHGRRVKLRYVHQGGQYPPTFVIHGNQVKALSESYKRYLINTFREKFELVGTPIRLEFKQGENPFEGRKNVLTTRQRQKRLRLMKHVKR